MFKDVLRGVIVIVASLLVSANDLSIALAADDGRAPVDAAIVKIESWLDGSQYESDWRNYLRLDRLKAELTRGDQANREVVANVLSQLRKDDEELKLARLVELRVAVENWQQVLQTPKVAELPDLFRKAKESVNFLTADEPKKTRAELDAALKQLASELEKSGKDAKRLKKLIDWEALQAEWKRPDGPDLAELRLIREKFMQDEPGLEGAAFLRVRDALQLHADTTFFAGLSADVVQKNVGQWLDIVATGLEGMAKDPTSDANAILVQRGIEYLTRARQTSTQGLINATRKHYGRPNLFIDIGRPIVAAAMEGPIPEDQRQVEISELILGTSIYGDGYLDGKLTLNLVPNPHRTVIEAVLSGTISSETIGYKGPVAIDAIGTTTVRATKRILIDRDGISSEPATSSATTDSTITDITSIKRRKMGRRFIEKMAWRKAGKSKQEAEAISAERAELRLNERMDAQVAKILEKGNQNFADNLQSPLLRRGAFPELIHFRTIAERIQLEVGLASPSQLTTTSPPPIASGEGITIRIHQSAVNNITALLMAGQTVTRDQLIKALEQRKLSDDALRRLIEERESDKKEGKDSWFVTYDDFAPVSATFDDGQVKVALRGKEYGRVGAAITSRVNMEVTVIYKIEKTGDSFKLVRQGDIVALPVNFKPGRQLKPDVKLLQQRLQTQFGRFYDSEMIIEPLPLPKGWRKKGALKLTKLAADDGWLTIGLNLEQAKTASTAPPK